VMITGIPQGAAKEQARVGTVHFAWPRRSGGQLALICTFVYAVELLIPFLGARNFSAALRYPRVFSV
jgi:hypothetical protein